MTMFEEYTDMYGYHFSKKLYEWAVYMMLDRNGNKIEPEPKQEVMSWLNMQGVTIRNNKGWDVPYTKAMMVADYWGSSITNDKQLALAIKDFLDDLDGNPCKAFDHFVVDYKAKSEPIFWEDFL